MPTVPRPRPSRLLAALGFAALVAALPGCATSQAQDSDDAHDQAQDLDLANITLDVELVSSFPAQPRAQVNRTGTRDASITSWNLRYMRTRDGFEGIVAFGREGDSEALPVRYLMALDANHRQFLMVDGVASERAAKARDAIATDREADFAAETFDDVTVAWLRAEMYRAVAQLQERADAAAGPRAGADLAPRAMTAGQACALRLAIYAASFVLPFTKVPLVGAGASLTGQFIGSFVLDAAGTALAGQLGEAARSTAAAAAGGLALESVLSQGPKLGRALGASGAGWAAAFAVGAVLGTDGDYQLAPGDRLERSPDGASVIVHQDGSRTLIPTGGFRTLLPATCRQALAER